ncbi:hypothetical protein AEPCKKLL_01614 [Stenotrophomonas maltophilia]|nr:hypothetical protein AEPCKKLL_01614 [Stenotrophomonas maltophilia]
MTRRQTAGAVRHRSAEPCRDWQRAPPGMTPDPCDREFRSIQVEHAGSAECILRRSMRGGCSAGLRPAPAPSWSNSNSNSRSWFPAGSRAGSGCGGRRKPVPGGLAAASMPRTPPQPDPPRLRQISAICRSTPCVDESLSDSEINWGQIRFPKENGSDPMTPCRTRINPTVTGKLSKVGRCRIAGCPRHGCRDQAPMDGFTASPQSDTAPPNPQKTRAVLALALALASSRCRAQPCRPTLPCARKRFHWFQQTVIPSPRQYHIAEQHAPTGDPC